MEAVFKRAGIKEFKFMREILMVFDSIYASDLCFVKKLKGFNFLKRLWVFYYSFFINFLVFLEEKIWKTIKKIPKFIILFLLKLKKKQLYHLNK